MPGIILCQCSSILPAYWNNLVHLEIKQTNKKSHTKKLSQKPTTTKKSKPKLIPGPFNLFYLIDMNWGLASVRFQNLLGTRNMQPGL